MGLFPSILAGSVVSLISSCMSSLLVRLYRYSLWMTDAKNFRVSDILSMICCWDTYTYSRIFTTYMPLFLSLKFVLKSTMKLFLNKLNALPNKLIRYLRRSKINRILDATYNQKPEKGLELVGSLRSYYVLYLSSPDSKNCRLSSKFPRHSNKILPPITQESKLKCIVIEDTQPSWPGYLHSAE